MARAGGMVTGIDMSAAALNAAKQHASEAQINLDYLESTAEDHAQSHPERYDIVTCLEMLEHVPDPGAIVLACEKMLKPGGHVFFSTLNRHPKAYLLAIIGAEYILNLLPKGTHEYAKFIRPSELNGFAENANLILKDMRGIHYNPLTQRFSFGQNVDVNYIACYKKA